MEACDHDVILLHKILYLVGGTGLLAEFKWWESTIDQKMIAVQRSLYAPTPLNLI
jgi:hypothetical protein